MGRDKPAENKRDAPGVIYLNRLEGLEVKEPEGRTRNSGDSHHLPAFTSKIYGMRYGYILYLAI